MHGRPQRRLLLDHRTPAWLRRTRPSGRVSLHGGLASAEETRWVFEGEPYPTPRVPPVTRAVLAWRAHLPEDPIAVPEDSGAAISLLLLPAGLCAVAFLYSVADARQFI